MKTLPIIKDTARQAYKLTSLLLVQDYDEFDTMRVVKRSDLKRELQVKHRGKTVRYNFRERGNEFNRHDFVAVDLTFEKDRIIIGCRKFKGVNAKTLLKWIKG